MSSVKAGAHLTAGMLAYARVLERAAPGVPITITSGERDADEQASAMLHKLAAKGEGELRQVYRQHDALITELLAAPRTVSAWADIIRRKGQRLSRHLWKGAFDVRTRDLTGTQVAKLRQAVAATGGRALLEYDHLHVDLPAKYAAMSAAETGGKLGVKVWLGVGVVGTVVFGLLVLRRRRTPAGAPAGRLGQAGQVASPLLGAAA